MDKTLIKSSEEWYKFLEDIGKTKFYYSRPSLYPVVVIINEYEDSQNEMWTAFEFVYLSDFNTK